MIKENQNLTSNKVGCHNLDLTDITSVAPSLNAFISHLIEMHSAVLQFYKQSIDPWKNNFIKSKIKITFEWMSQNGHAYFENLAAFAVRCKIFKVSDPFWDVMH